MGGKGGVNYYILTMRAEENEVAFVAGVTASLSPHALLILLEPLPLLPRAAA